jgi:hypothetical protein
MFSQVRTSDSGMTDIRKGGRTVKGNEKLLTALNQLLADELTAISQYTWTGPKSRRIRSNKWGWRII